MRAALGRMDEEQSAQEEQAQEPRIELLKRVKFVHFVKAGEFEQIE